MGYNPGVQRLGPMDVAGLLQRDREFSSKLPIDRMQAQSYSRQVAVQEKEQEQRRKDELRILKQENDKQRQLAVAFGMPKEVAEASSIGQLMGFNEQAAREWNAEQKLKRSPEQVARDVAETDWMTAQTAGAAKVGETVDLGDGRKGVRSGPTQVTPIADDSFKEENLRLREIADLNRQASVLEFNQKLGIARPYSAMDPSTQQRYARIKDRLAELGEGPADWRDSVVAGEKGKGEKDPGAAAGDGKATPGLDGKKESPLSRWAVKK